MEITLHQPNKTDRVHQEEGLWSSQEELSRKRKKPASQFGKNLQNIVPYQEYAMAGKKGGKRKKKVETVFLVCDETGEYNYTLRRKSGSEKLKVKKYCPRLRRHTSHTEKKK